MTKKTINTSPHRGSFSKENRLKKLLLDEIDPSDDQYFNILLSFDQERLEKENEPSWQEHNLEFDLRSTEWIIDKVKGSNIYAQHLYAALCNNEFIQLDNTWDILQEKYWGCSWRYAGGIISDIQEHGDYIDWYCSGISDFDINNLYVSEGIITDEIKEDLNKLGWVVVFNRDNNDNI